MDNVIYHHPTSVCIFLLIQCTKSSMKLIWKYGRLSSNSFLKYSIPFYFGVFHIPYRNFRFIPFHFSFHSMPWLSILHYYYYCKFYFNEYSQVENPEAPDFEKIVSASGFFSTLSLPSSLPLPTSLMEVLLLPHPCCTVGLRKFNVLKPSAIRGCKHFQVFG